MSASSTHGLVVRARGLSVVLVAATIVALIADGGRTGTASPVAALTASERNGRIVYADPGPGRASSMFTVDADGRDRRLLTSDGGIWPQWSPDGTKLLFTRGDSFFVMRAGPGAGRRPLVKGPINGSAGGLDVVFFGLAAHWSPDGRRIVFATVRGIEVANVDGSGRRLLLRNRPQQLYFGDPDWSPDGRRIVLVGNSWAPLTWPSVPQQIYLMHSDGTGLRQLTAGFLRFHRDPAWSRDGRWILFAQCPAPWATSRVSELVLSKPDGSDQRTIARLSGTDCASMITWSPDGRKILYVDEGAGVEEMNADGSARRHLLPWDLGVAGLSWQPLP